MSKITEYLTNLMEKRYGKDVRQSIHDSIKLCYDISTGAQGSATASANTAIAKASEAVAAAKEATTKAEEAIEAAEQAQISAENAEAATGVGIASQTKAGLVKGGENYIDESGELQLTKHTDSPTLYNSYAGGIKLNELGGVSKQDSTTGYNLLDCRGLVEQTVGNVTFTPVYDANGNLEYVEANGTPSTLSEYRLCSNYPLPNGTYILSGAIASNKKIFVNYGSIWATDVGNGVKFGITDSSKLSVVIQIETGVTCDNIRFYPMIRLASVTDATYEPYTGGQPSPNPEYPQVIKSVEGKNLLDCRGLVAKTNNGVTFTPVYDENGNLEYINADGTASASVSYILEELNTLSKGEYILSGCPSNGASTTYRLHIDGVVNDYGTGGKFTANDGVTYKTLIYINAGYTATNLRFYPMIRPASIADDTYVPYGLLRFWGHGENQCHILETDYGYVEPDAKYTHMVQYRYIKVFLKAGTYTISEHGATDKFLKLLRIVSDDYYYGGVTTITNGSYTFYHEKDGEVYFSFGRATTFGGTSVDDTFTEDELLEYVIQINESYFIILSNPIKLNGVGAAQDKFVRKDGVWKTERNIVEEVCTTATGIDSLGLVANIKTNGIPKGHFDVMTVANIMCDKFIPDSLTGARQKEYGIAQYGNGLYIRVGSIEQTVDAYNSWLAENPITVQYESIEPTYEDLPTADQTALNSLVSYDGITYLHCDSEVQPTWDLEYGTSRVGGYSLEAWNTAMSEKILNEARYNEIVAAMLVMNQE